MQLNLNVQYPRNDEFEIVARLAMMDFDKEREIDLRTDNGFIIEEHKGIKKDLKAKDGIFSPRYGQTLKDINPFGDPYKCECGFLNSRINNGLTCPLCKTKVKRIDNNLSYFGWILLKYDHYIHPLLYKKLESFFGKSAFENMLNFQREEDIDGNLMDYESNDPSQPYKFAGMKYFEEHFDEIMKFYLKQRPAKRELYDDIMANREKIFTRSIPVYTTLLRPFDTDGKFFYHEESNPKFNIINVNATKLNKRKLAIENNLNSIEKLLHSLQTAVNDLYIYITTILTGKKGNIRQLFGGRYNFSSRCVIVSDNTLRIDQIRLPYKCLVVWLEPQIKNILVKSYNMTYNEADEYLFKAKVKSNRTVANIIESIIHSYPEGLPCLINRNPTINYGSLLQMFCIGMNKDLDHDYTMSLPLQILPLLAADSTF